MGNTFLGYVLAKWEDINISFFLWCYELNIDSNDRVSAKKTQPKITNFKNYFVTLVELRELDS